MGMHRNKRHLDLDETTQLGSKAKRAKTTKADTPESSAHSAGPIADEHAASLGCIKLVADDDARQGTTVHLKPELQSHRCLAPRYRLDELGVFKCAACISKITGETCRFQGLRFLMRDDSDKIVGTSFGENKSQASPALDTPTSWNTDLQLTHIEYVKHSVAKALLPILKEEMQHIKLPDVIRRPREMGVRATCDACLTSTFSTSWMCRKCGREACLDCFAYIRDGTGSETPPECRATTSPRNAPRSSFQLMCSNRNPHQLKDFSPVSRFRECELAQAIEDMEALLNSVAEPSNPNPNPSPNPNPNPSEGPADIELPPAPASLISGGDPSSSVLPSATPESAHLPLSLPAPTVPEPPLLDPVLSQEPIPSHDTTTFSDSELTEEIFRELWRRGDPLVVTGLLEKFRIQWTPKYFSDNYGKERCSIVECQCEDSKQEMVSRFFSRFGNYEDRHGLNWKLKDWPPSTDFKTTFPELYDDFVRVTPVPNYVRRDGVLNIASHFPSKAVGPDLGPKMYNALASFESKGSKGSTRLHMDMADAVNIMTYASPKPDGSPGCAAWDIYKAGDTPRLRAFLEKKFAAVMEKKFGGKHKNADPIHAQMFYLDAELRAELYRDYGVVSHRIYQRPGEAVFIPAGCAHQVCNLADCIKVACDFVSPENVGRCGVLTREFREQNEVKPWKEDVLQLRTMMWYAWLSCVRQEKAISNNP